MMMKPLVPKSVFRAIAFLEKKFIKYADLVIGACDATVNYYREMGAKNTLVVGNWKDPSLYAFSSDQIKKKRTEIGCEDQLVVSYIGSLTIDRNVIPLVQAIKTTLGLCHHRWNRWTRIRNSAIVLFTLKCIFSWLYSS